MLRGPCKVHLTIVSPLQHKGVLLVHIQYVCTLYLIILKGIWDMTAREAAVRAKDGCNLCDVSKAGDHVTQFDLYSNGRWGVASNVIPSNNNNININIQSV